MTTSRTRTLICFLHQSVLLITPLCKSILLPSQAPHTHNLRTTVAPPGRWWTRGPLSSVGSSPTSSIESYERNIEDYEGPFDNFDGTHFDPEESILIANHIAVEHAYVTNDSKPRSYKQALKSSDWPLWEKATQEELDNCFRNNTLSMVKHLVGRNIVGSRLVIKVKHDADGNVYRYKARLVA